MKYKNKVHDVYKVAFKLANNAKLVKLSEYVYVFEFWTVVAVSRFPVDTPCRRAARGKTHAKTHSHKHHKTVMFCRCVCKNVERVELNVGSPTSLHAPS